MTQLDVFAIKNLCCAIREMLCVSSNPCNVGVLVEIIADAIDIFKGLSQLSHPNPGVRKLNLTRSRIRPAEMD